MSEMQELVDLKILDCYVVLTAENFTVIGGVVFIYSLFQSS